MLELIETYIIVSLIIYFFPFLLSLLTRNKIGAVFVMNLFLGWTFIGWIWALIWAVTSDKKQEQIVIHNHSTTDKSVDKLNNPIETKNITEVKIDNTSLLNQLSQLHSLKEKNVIPENIYEQERQVILNKLQKQEQIIRETAVTETIVQQPSLEPLSEQEEINATVVKPLLHRKAWYQSAVFDWVFIVGVVIVALVIWFLISQNKTLPTEPSDDSINNNHLIQMNLKGNVKRLYRTDECWYHGGGAAAKYTFNQKGYVESVSLVDESSLLLGSQPMDKLFQQENISLIANFNYNDKFKVIKIDTLLNKDYTHDLDYVEENGAFIDYTETYRKGYIVSKKYKYDSNHNWISREFKIQGKEGIETFIQTRKIDYFK